MNYPQWWVGGAVSQRLWALGLCESLGHPAPRLSWKFWAVSIRTYREAPQEQEALLWPLPTREEPPGEGSAAERVPSQEHLSILFICQRKRPAPESPTCAGAEEKWTLGSSVCYFLCCPLGSPSLKFTTAFSTVTNRSWHVSQFHKGPDTC